MQQLEITTLQREQNSRFEGHNGLKMEPLRWNEAKPKDHRTKHENQACLVADKGLDVANYSRASGGGRKMFLISPLTDQAIAVRREKAGDL